MTRTTAIAGLFFAAFAALTATAALADDSIAALAGPTERRSRLPLCYGNATRVNTLKTPSGRQFLACRDTAFPGGACQWLLSRPRASSYWVDLVKPPTPRPTPGPLPPPRTSVGAFASLAVPGVPSSVRLQWPDGTIIPAFRGGKCSQDLLDDLDTSDFANLGASATDGPLLFILPGGTAEHIRPVNVRASATANCHGQLAVQTNIGTGWVDHAIASMSSGTVRNYEIHTSVEPGSDVRLVARTSGGVCSFQDAEINVELCVPDQANPGRCL